MGFKAVGFFAAHRLRRAAKGAAQLVRIGAYIRLHLIGVSKAIGAIEDVHDRDDFGNTRIVQPEPLHGGAVGVNSVGAVIGDGHRQGDDFLGQRVKFPGFHDGL